MAKKKNQVQQIVDEYKDLVDIPFVNAMIEQNGKLGDFEMNKTTIRNIAEWSLNGDSNKEIRKKLELNRQQWEILTNICPVLVMVMRDTRHLADLVVAGSLFQTAIGGKTIRRQVVKSVKEYDDKGRICGEKLEKVWLEEELPPNPILLKFLAEHKLSEQFGEKHVDNSAKYREVIDSFSSDELALIQQAKEQLEKEDKEDED